MTITTTATTARTDAPAKPAVAAVSGTDASPAGTTTAVAPMVAAATVRRIGLGLAAGAGLWAFQIFAWGINPTEGFGARWNAAFSLAFQLGLFGLLRAQYVTRATGTSRRAVAMIKVEHVLLGLATLWTTIVLAEPALQDTLPVQLLDMFWPLSMLGMMAIGIKIALAGRWRGAARVWPGVAESWVLVTIPATCILGGEIGGYVGATHLLVGYGILGAVLAVRPGLTGARD